MKKILMPLVLILACLLAACAGGGNLEQVEEPTTENTQPQKMLAPDFTVIDQDGKEVRLSDMKGKPVVLNFWASWCPPCKAEMPDFQQVYDRMGDQVTFMIVNATDGQSETVDSAKKHIADNGFTFPVYFDTKLEAANAYYVSSIPVTFFIDAEGYLITYASSKIGQDVLVKGIEIITSVK